MLTTGGTGPARRDVTPEATLAVGTKEMPGFGEQMRQISLHFVPTAILSRQVAVIRETADHAALIMNLPGQPKSIKETLEGLKDADGKQVVGGIFAAVPYCIDLIGGPYIETNPAVCKAFRPKSAHAPDRSLSKEHDMTNCWKTSKSKPRPIRPSPSSGCTAWAPTATTSCRWCASSTCAGLPGDPLRLPACADTMPVTINGGYVMRAWYDILGTDLARREDEAGLRASQQQIEALIAREKARGIPAERIILAGFSQGCAMTLQTGLRHPEKLAGMLCLSGYVPLADKVAAERHAGQPGHADLHGARPRRSGGADRPRRAVARPAASRSATTVEWHEYTMQHSLCPEEVDDIGAWLRRILG